MAKWRINPTLTDNNKINTINTTPNIYIGSSEFANIPNDYILDWNTTINITITTNNGYKFDSNNLPYLRLHSVYSNFGDGINFTLSNNDTTATLSGVISNLSNGRFTQAQFEVGSKIFDLYTTIIEAVTPPNITYTNNIHNSTFTNIVNNDNSVTITIIANNGYYFNTIPNITYIDTNEQSETVNFTLSNNNTIATITIYPILGDSTATINGTCIIIPNHNIINNVINTTLTSDINNNTVELTLTPIAANYHFTTIPTVEYYENGILKTDTFTINKIDFIDIATISITADKTDIIINGVCQIAIPITKDLSNVTLTGINDYLIPSNQNILNLTITANMGFCLDTPPYIELWGVSISGDTIYFELNTQDEPITTAILNYNLDNTYNINYIRNIFIHSFATPLTAYNFGAINVYKVTKQNLNDFSLIRFANNRNLNDFVVSLKQLYCNIGYTILNTLKCGDIDTQINVGEIINDKIEINCNSIIIPFKNNNNVDYDTELNLFLPFYGMYNLNNSVIGRRLNITYVVSTLTGQGFIYLKDITDNNDYIIDKLSVDISSNLFYEKITDNASINQFTPNYLNGLTPILYMKYYDNKNNYIYDSDCIRAVLNTFSGFISVTELTDFNNNSITETEYKEIINLLNNGVFIEN